MGLDVGAWSAFAAGILSFLSPCILPLVPPYLCFLTGSSLDDLTSQSPAGAASQAFGRALAFVLGFSAVFIALGASASWIGQLISDHLAAFARIAGLIIVVLGLQMLGLFRFLVLMREGRVQVNRRPASLLGAFVVGLAFAFGWSPCVGPILTSILLLAGAEETVLRGAGLLAAYAAGIGLPFLAAALFTGPFLRWLSRFRKHLGAVEKVMGAALVITGALIFFGVMPIIAGWLVETVPALGRIG